MPRKMSRGGKWRGRQCAQAAALLAAAVAMSTPVLHAQTLYNGPSGGSWDTAGNWDNGIPIADSDALIVEAPSGGLFTVNFNDNYSSATAIGELALDSVNAAEQVQLIQGTSGDNLFSATEIIGDNGPDPAHTSKR
jgi:hypothetical protein